MSPCHTYAPTRPHPTTTGMVISLGCVACSRSGVVGLNGEVIIERDAHAIGVRTA